MRTLALITLLGLLTACGYEPPPIKNQPLAGVLNGQPWHLQQVEHKRVDIGFGKYRDDYVLSSHPCPGEVCAHSIVPRIFLNLRLDEPGGRLSPTNNIAIRAQPKSNKVVIDGDYTVTKQNGRIRLGLVFRIDDDNYLEGFAYLN